MKRARTDVSKESRRNFILDCAEEIIKNEGLAGLNLQQVAKKSKLAIGTIYLYFEKKEDLIAQLTLKSRQFLVDVFEKSTKNEPNAITKISKLLEAYYHFYKSQPHYNELVSFFEKNAGLEEPELLRSASVQIHDLVIQILKRGKLQGIIREDIDEKAFSFLLWGTTVGVIQLIDVKSIALKNALELDSFDFFRQHISLIINSIQKK
ncbi:MAG: TetR/AcrR family transcriptional regulator [Chitinophagaceae bacterium]|nr:TetR/AcrR family transcriptional regulator [Chitinophagaceae bacterium]